MHAFLHRSSCVPFGMAFCILQDAQGTVVGMYQEQVGKVLSYKPVEIC
jgi:hypothetical protein